jgi:predicted ATP-binding protein involved in virulence
MFDQSEDPMQADNLRKYVLSFWIHKPNETISREECSAGERKIIKSFSTLLNRDYTPKIILIDNVSMHVESGRHLDLIYAMRQCFPFSQIFATTHSYRISKNYGDRSQLYDMRILRASEFIRSNPWRLYLRDEIDDALSKLKATTLSATDAMNVCSKTREQVIEVGDELLSRCLEKTSEQGLLIEAENFLKQAAALFVKDNFLYYSRPV